MSLTFSYETNDSLSHLTLHVKKTDIERNWNMSFVVEKTDGVLPTTIDLQDEEADNMSWLCDASARHACW